MGDWREQAACKHATSLFYPVNPNSRKYRRTLEVAKRICNSCPVKQQCEQEAKDNDEQYGIWAGEDVEAARRQARVDRINAKNYRKIYSDNG